MTEPIKIRAQRQGEFTDIRILLAHPMENGLRRDEKGQLVPAHFIQTFVVELNGKPLIHGQLNTSVAKNPLFALRARDIKAGDKLAVAWNDNTGASRRDEISVS